MFSLVIHILFFKNESKRDIIFSYFYKLSSFSCERTLITQTVRVTKTTYLAEALFHVCNLHRSFYKITQQNRQRFFSPFYRSKNENKYVLKYVKDTEIYHFKRLYEYYVRRVPNKGRSQH